MCLTLVVHRTNCESRRVSVVNPLTGLAIYHPFQDPFHCHHYSVFANYPCNSHGACCTLGKWQICLAQHLGRPCFGWQAYHVTGSAGNPFATWPEQQPENPANLMQDADPIILGLQDVRRRFFDAGAEVYEAREAALHIGVEGRPDLFIRWRQNAVNLAQRKQVWEQHTARGDLEIVPVYNTAELHPWAGILQFGERVPGFPLHRYFLSFDLPEYCNGVFPNVDWPANQVPRAMQARLIGAEDDQQRPQMAHNQQMNQGGPNNPFRLEGEGDNQLIGPRNDDGQEVSDPELSPPMSRIQLMQLRRELRALGSHILPRQY